MLYQYGILKQHRFSLPIINVGNLSVGGTGKSPHVEFFHHLLTPIYRPAIVSRGYHRTTKGVRIVTMATTALEVGDEPMQFKINFPDTTVVVAEQRALGIQEVLRISPTVNCILLDDAFQHWGIQATVQVLLTTFEEPFVNDWVLPMGRLREFRSGYKRADIIIVTKCPPTITTKQRNSYLQQIDNLKHQQIFFSYFNYQAPYALLNPKQTLSLDILKDAAILIVTAIAKTKYLEQFMCSHHLEPTYLCFPDHHHFKPADLDQIKKQGKGKYILITQKDATKLIAHQEYFQAHKLAIYVLPIEVEIAFGEAVLLKKRLLELM